MMTVDEDLSLPEQTLFQQRVRPVSAQYKISSLPLYMGNPLIEALEDYLTYSRKAIAKKFEHKAGPCHPQANISQREHLLANLITQLFIPLPRHLLLHDAIDLLIRTGYRRRRPRPVAEYTKLLVQSGQLTEDEEQDLLAREIEISNYQDALSCTVIGPSGTGKTYAVCRALSFYPQLIIHDNICGMQKSVQIVYLKVECPHDGSIKSLCASIIAQIDAITGENFTELYINKGRSTATVLRNRVGRLLYVYNVGLLVIDEIQNLLVSRMEHEKLFNFIVSLSNTLSVPLLFIGTPKAQKLIDTDLRIARRFGSYGLIRWERLALDSPDWKSFISQLWSNNLLKDEDQQIPRPIELKLYEYSQGITNILVRLFVLSQKMAWVNQRERLTKGTIDKTFKTYFGNVKPMVEAIKNNDVQDMARYEDIIMADADFKSAWDDLSCKLDDKLKAKDEISSQVNEVTMRLLCVLEQMKIPLDQKTKELVQQITDSNADLDVPVSSMVMQFLKRWEEASQSKMQTAGGDAQSGCKSEGGAAQTPQDDDFGSKADQEREQIVPSSSDELENL